MLVQAVRFLVLAVLAAALGAAGGSFAFVGQPLPFTELPSVTGGVEMTDEIAGGIRHKMEWRLQ